MPKNKILVFVPTYNEKQNISDLFYNIIKISPEYDVLIIDDMIDTAGTTVNASEAAMRKGAESVTAIATHGVLSGQAIDRLKNSPITRFILTDTIHIPNEKKLDKCTVSEAQEYLKQGHFGEGSMEPKIKSAIYFLDHYGTKVVLTSLNKLEDALKGNSGT